MKNLPHKMISFCLAAKLALVISTSAIASETNVEFAENLRRADLVFEGVVSRILHKSSEGSTASQSEASGQLPYTFITYNVIRILKGPHDLSTVTLRFLGGPEKSGKAFVVIPGFPLFDLNDHDLLLVKGNEIYPCPLVDCSKGRFRYIDGLVVNELGQTLELSDTGKIRFGQAVKLDEINTHQVSEKINITRNEVTEFGNSEPIDPNTLDEPEEGLRPDPDTFSVYVDDEVQRVHSYQELQHPSTFKNSDPSLEIFDSIMDLVSSTADLPPNEALDEEGYKTQEMLDEEERLLLNLKMGSPITKPPVKILKTVFMEPDSPKIFTKKEVFRTAGSTRKTNFSSQFNIWMMMPFTLLAGTVIFIKRKNRNTK